MITNRCYRALAIAAFLLLGTSTAQATDIAAESPVAPPEHRRPADQTFLTFPEWFLVYSSNEYAAFLGDDRRPSEFPFFGHLDEFWESYAAVYRVTKDDRPFNAGYNLMIMVIGLSTTVEYTIHAGYESLFGRLAEETRIDGQTDEEKYGARVARNYVEFIRMNAWYDFDFLRALRGLWTETSFIGPDMPRKWERKYALTTEYLVKAAYGRVLERATRATYDVPLPVTAIVVNKLPPGITSRLPQLAVLKTMADGTALITVPRYDIFKRYAMALAVEGVKFEEIAGNRSVILISVLTKNGWQPTSKEARVLFTQPILTRPGIERTAFAVPVAALGNTLVGLDLPGVELERIYDY